MAAVASGGCCGGCTVIMVGAGCAGLHAGGAASFNSSFFLLPKNAMSLFSPQSQYNLSVLKKDLVTGCGTGSSGFLRERIFQVGS